MTASRAVQCLQAREEHAPPRTLFDHVRRISGTFDTQCAVDDAGRALCRGRCDLGQCGVAHSVFYSAVPLRVALAR